MDDPTSKYSSFVTTISLKVESEARILPPIQVAYIRSCEAVTLTAMAAGARTGIWLSTRSLKPGNIVVPPDNTMFEYIFLRRPCSHFIIALYMVSMTPSQFLPHNVGENKDSATKNCSSSSSISFPSGRVYI